MKHTGIVRRMDDLGRVTIPKEIRHFMDMHEGDAMEISTEGDKIILQKYPSERHFQIEYCIEEKDVKTLDGSIDDDDVYEELEQLLPRGAIIHTIFDTDRNEYIYEE